MVLLLQGVAHVICSAYSVIVSASLDCLIAYSIMYTNYSAKMTKKIMMIGFLHELAADEVAQPL